MKILIVDLYYSQFLDRFYADRPVQYADYSEERRAILDRCFGTADFYSRNLDPLGVEAEEIVSNCEHLQKRWAAEHGVRYKSGHFLGIPKLRDMFRSDWRDKILTEQVRACAPDVIYSQALGLPSEEVIGRSGVKPKLIVGQVASPVAFDRAKLGYYDLILTSFPHFVQRFKDIGIDSEYFRIGFEPSLLSKLRKNTEPYGAVFVGGFSAHHRSMLESFEYAAERAPIDFWGYGASKLPVGSPIRARHHGPAWGLDMYNILYNSRISVNRHIDAAENNANNMRLYESTGVGTMLITDYKDNIGELFEVGKEIETYRTKEELADKINYYLSHEEERARIAAAGQARTLRDHTYAIRMKELKAILERHLCR